MVRMIGGHGARSTSAGDPGATRRDASGVFGGPIGDHTGPGSDFQGSVTWVRLDVGDAALEQPVPPDDRLRIALARQ